MNVKDNRGSGLSYVEFTAVTVVTGAVGKSAIAPIDRIKILLQSQYDNIRQGRLLSPYRGPIDCIRRTYASEGLRSFWRGNLSTCFLPVPSAALTMALKEAMKTVAPTSKDASVTKKMLTGILTGGVAAGISIGVFFPFGYARTRLAADVISKSEGGSNVRQFGGFRDLYRATLQSHGVKGLYRGFPISVFGIIWYRSLYFGLYDTFKDLSLTENSGIVSLFGVAYGTTMLAATLSYPFDTIRVRLMMNNCSSIRYRGAIDCASYIFKNEGPQSFMKGFTLNIVRGVAGAAFLTYFEALKTIYTHFRSNSNKGSY